MILESIKVAIVDRQRVFADALVFRLQNEAGIEVVSSTGEIAQAAALVIASHPDVVILDAELPEGLAFKIAAEIRSRLESAKILFLSHAAADLLIDQALRLRADGILLRDEPLRNLVDGIRSAASGQATFSPGIGERIAFDSAQQQFRLRVDPPISGLTERQIEILRHLARGDSVKAVARKLFLSPKSVDNQKFRIMSKLGVRDKVSLALYAVREGLIQP
jgi:DNA-binding NarL/FixJ family response regulator